jgi:hypothetical protein
MRVRASDENTTSFAAMFRDSLLLFRYAEAFDDVESAHKRVA